MAAPPNGTCATAIDVTALLPYTVVVDTTGASTDTEVTPTCDDNGGSKAVWWKITNTTTKYMLVAVDTTGSDYYQDISAWTGATCGSLMQVTCSDNAYSGNDFYVTFAAAPSLSYWILILDDDTGSGGSLDLTITSWQIAAGDLIVATDKVGADFEANNQAFDNTGASIAVDTSYGGFSTSIGFVQYLAARPSDGYLVGFRSDKLYMSSPSLGLLSATTVSKPTVNTWGWAGICFAANNRLYALWKEEDADTSRHALQIRDASTFLLETTWLNFDTDTLPIVGGAVNIDGTQYFYGKGIGSATPNVIRVLDLDTGTPSTFATYGSWNDGASTGDVLLERCFRVLEDGRVFACALHQTTGTIDGGHILEYAAGGSLTHAYALTTVGTEVVQSLAVTDDGDFVWVITNTNHLDQYKMSDGTRQIHSAAPVGGLIYGDLLGDIPSPEPPPTPTTTTYPTVRERVFALPFESNLILFLERIEFLIQAGEGLVTGQGSDPVVAVWFSKDGGKTYGNGYTVRPGKMGEYDKRAYLNRLGRARNWVCKIRVSDPVFWAFLDCYVDMSEGTS